MNKVLFFKDTQKLDIIKFENIKSMFDDDFKRIVFDMFVDFDFFKAKTTLEAEESDFINMKKCLEKIYNREWNSFVVFNPIGEQISIQFTLQESGQIKVHTKLCNPMFTGILEFEFLTKSTFLPELIQEIETVIHC